MRLIEINKIAEASEKISALVRTTECQKSNYFSKLFNTNVFYKREDQQKIKSFKIRGAYTIKFYHLTILISTKVWFVLVQEIMLKVLHYRVVI